MNKLYLKEAFFSSLFLGLVMSSPLAYSENIKTEKMEYKCYLKTTKGYEIAFYRWEVNNFQINVAKLPAQKVPGSKIYIKDVEECVELNEMFSIGHAQKLDEETAR